MNVTGELSRLAWVGLNPLGIGEGFEPIILQLDDDPYKSLNPLGIGEGFERKHDDHYRALEVLIP